MLLGHTEIVHCDKYVSFLNVVKCCLACQGLSAHWQKSHSFETFVRWDENKGESKWCITEPWVSLAISAGGINNKLHFSKLRQVIFLSESFRWPAKKTEE